VLRRDDDVAKSYDNDETIEYDRLDWLCVVCYDAAAMSSRTLFRHRLR